MEENKPSQKVKKKHPEVRRNNRCLLESIKSEKATQLKAGEGTSRRRQVRRTQPHKASTSECPGGGNGEAKQTADGKSDLGGEKDGKSEGRRGN